MESINIEIGQHLPKLWAIKYGFIFYETRCTYSSFVLLAGNNDTLQLTLVSSQNSLSHCTTDQLISRLF